MKPFKPFKSAVHPIIHIATSVEHDTQGDIVLGGEIAQVYIKQCSWAQEKANEMALLDAQRICDGLNLLAEHEEKEKRKER